MGAPAALQAAKNGEAQKRQELEKQRAAEEAEEQRKIAEKLEQLAVKEAKVKAETPQQFQSRCVMRDAGEGEH